MLGKELLYFRFARVSTMATPIRTLTARGTPTGWIRRPTLRSLRVSIRLIDTLLCSLRVGHSPRGMNGYCLCGSSPIIAGLSALFESLNDQELNKNTSYGF